MKILCVSPGSCMGESRAAVRERETCRAKTRYCPPGSPFSDGNARHFVPGITHRLCEAVVPSRHIPAGGVEASADGDEAFAGGVEASADGDEASAGGDEASTDGDEASTGGDEASVGGDVYSAFW